MKPRDQLLPWRKWGPYLSEQPVGDRARDYSEAGNAWDYFSHDQSRSRTYRWGEDGLAGISDDKQHLCFALRQWNGKDPILKERLFGLTNAEGNHGEDVKEYYFYLDSTPTHSYMKYLYKYPQAEYPYSHIVDTSKRRGRDQFEYELIDTGVFDQNRYFDVFVEYAKESPEDVLVRITVHNRGPESATLNVLPTLWFRNEWAGHTDHERPALQQVAGTSGRAIVRAVHPVVGERYLYCEGDTPLLFTENETNTQRIFGVPNRSPYVKDGINNYVVHGQTGAVNPEKVGTKVAAHYQITVNPGEARSSSPALGRRPSSADSNQRLEGRSVRRRVRRGDGHSSERGRRVLRDCHPGRRRRRRGERDATGPGRDDLEQAIYFYDVDKWLDERGCDPFKENRKQAPRNEGWHHMYNGDIISMPDKWEYPWYAAWDLAFHVLALTLVDPDFGKQQLKLMLRERYMHPNGQIPAYEWNFGDVNPPVHAWSTIFTYRLEKAKTGAGDKDFLKSNFQKLLLNFTWWVNRKDRTGRNVFEGGFLGLDNIGVFDRSAPLPTGGYLEQADGTAWMALFCQNMMEITAELVMTDPDYADMALKFCEHFLWIASSMTHLGGETGMWDEQDGFFYDVLRLPDGRAERLKVRSMVGLLPLCAATVFDGSVMAKYPELGQRLMWFLESRPEIRASIHDPMKLGVAGRRLTSILDETKLRRVLEKMLDENEFLSEFGLRSLSRFHEKHPFVMNVGGQEYRVGYLPAESDTGMFGGNSNWRGPIWMPVNGLIIRALLQYHTYYGDDFTVECPTGSGQKMNLYQVAEEITRRLSNIFLRDKNGHRPVYGGAEKFQNDPNWRDLVLFYEYFHGDNGAGLGASHQTGWTGMIARAMHLFATTTSEQVLQLGKAAPVTEIQKPRSGTAETIAGTSGS